ncbi:AAA family ATPase [Nocardioides humilatus]|uniref:AAA family ATPase n=1 Tax=Nocardioides humilatus TaxID=2607660 RepID=A0A5B1LGN4_9ACTN|nr:helix-turn-helix transcriptional regulator [Nocardioides humilatus]KAA1418960.1 AAA family ATPase [Nocardioides humilatus]
MSVGVVLEQGGAELRAGLGLAWDDPPMARVRSRQMVGRDRDLATLLDLAEAVRTGEPRLALVMGEAGIGKTRLTQEFAERLSDALVLTGHGVDLATGELPFGVVADTLADLVRQRGVEALTADERALLGPLLPGAVPAATDPARVLAGAVSLFNRLAGAGLVCWVVEDLQWSDEASRDLVSVLGRRESGQLLVIATVRTGGLADQRPGSGFAAYLDGLTRLPAAETVTLERLGADDVRRQLADLVDDLLPPDAVRLILDVGDGVPFVVEELAAARGRPGLTNVAAVAEARLGALSSGARRLVEAAAVGDGQLVWPLLEAVVELAPEELDEALLGAVRAGILEETPGREGVRFRHALLRDAADRAIPPAARRGWHRRWAEALGAGPGIIPGDAALMAVANHWRSAGEPEQEALAAFAATESARWTGGGVQELGYWERVVELWPQAGVALEAAGCTRHLAVAWVLRLATSLEGARAIELLDRLERSAGDELERHAVAMRRHTAVRAKTFDALAGTPQRHSELARTFREALPDPLAIDSLSVLAHFTPADDSWGSEVLQEMRDLSHARGDDRSALINAGRQAWRFFSNGEADRAVEHIEAAIESARDVSTTEQWAVDGNLIWTLISAGRYAEAESAIARAIGRVPDPVAAGVNFEHIVENAASCWINTGQWTRAEALIRRARPYWGTGPRSSEVRLAELELLRAGRLTDPEGWLAAIDQPPVPSGASPRWIAETVAWHAAAEGDFLRFRELLAPTWRDAVAEASDELWSPSLAALRIEVDAVARRGGVADRAAVEHVAAISTVLKKLYRFGDLGTAWDAEVNAQLARFRGEPSRFHFEAAVRAWDQVGHPYDGAVARLGLAEAEVADDREAARRHAEEALAAARELGAGPLRDDAEAFLKRYRLASRTVETPGKPGALTARELEVLEVLAEGRTNEQIASMLYMSPKTASVHVSRILAKLGAENRTEAVAVARRIGLL